VFIAIQGSPAAISVGVLLMMSLSLVSLAALIVMWLAGLVTLRLAKRAGCLEGLGVFASIWRGIHLLGAQLRGVGLTWLVVTGLDLVYPILAAPVGILLAAAGFLTEAEALNAQFGDKINTMIILRGWAQVKLAAGEIDLALEDAQRAVDLAAEVSEAIEQGINLRILGQVYAALDRCQEALDLFQQSEALLAEEYPYEAARTLLQWGSNPCIDGKLELSISLLAKARATFRTLEAQQELAAIEIWPEGPNDLKDRPSPPAL
jgi:tetratricopeptide (TPR) repeat protein